MSKQIERLMKKYPQVFHDVEYGGNVNKNGDPVPLQSWGSGTWLYMNPSWYCTASDSNFIHEYSIAGVLDCAKHIYQDKERWIEANPDETEDIKRMMRGDFDKYKT